MIWCLLNSDLCPESPKPNPPPPSPTSLVEPSSQLKILLWVTRWFYFLHQTWVIHGVSLIMYIFFSYSIAWNPKQLLINGLQTHFTIHQLVLITCYTCTLDDGCEFQTHLNHIKNRFTQRFQSRQKERGKSWIAYPSFLLFESSKTHAAACIHTIQN